MKFLKKLLNDLLGLFQVVGPRLATLWGFKILSNLPIIIQGRNLQAADRAMGLGPFKIHHPRCKSGFKIMGFGAFSGIREMYVRDTYLHGGLLTIDDGDTVVDLGANMGNFTNLALAHGPSVKVISVEPGLELNKMLRTSVGQNEGFLARTQLVRAFLGSATEKQDSKNLDKQYDGAAWLTEEELIESASITKIDFLKCDIEGGEFALLQPSSKILQMTRKIGIEVHHFGGDVEGFLSMLKTQGFDLMNIQRDPDGTVTALGIRR